jgi:hypothetical protein
MKGDGERMSKIGEVAMQAADLTSGTVKEE